MPKGQDNVDKTIEKVEKEKWEYHSEKAELLLLFCYLIKKNE